MYKIGIDASRNRSGGAKAHIIGILSNVESLNAEINEVHLWSYSELLSLIPDYPWLKKHTNQNLEKTIIHQIWWQYFVLKREAKKMNLDILLNTDAGTVCRFYPSVTMSRDMLSYEEGEMQRFGYGFQRLRLILLRSIQNYSLKNSTAAIFLTQYAANKIQKYSGPIKKIAIVNHGISEDFRVQVNKWYNKDRIEKPIRCTYVSNVVCYKHQGKVAQAISLVRKKGVNIEIDFVGGGSGKYQIKLDEIIENLDPLNLFLFQKNFVKHSELPNLLKKTDVFLFASSCENMPNTLIEGMCANLPIVCSDRGPMPEVLKDGGIYFDPENVLSIVKALEEIINNEALRFNLTDKALFLSKQFSWKKCRIETFDFLIKMIKYNENE
ncbi:glycosyltransferase family 4 protein [Flavobacterium psychrophilum]|nr:glycosyltransferase family 4 protein [Flavobacterium psychrophilum]EKT4510218.1 glycosyltransferase family 4 protein [Flavobacterium psychrophilum]